MLPFFEFTIDPNDSEMGLNGNALVDFPAHMKKLVAFNKDGHKQNFAITNEDERVVMGVLISADTPIYRKYQGFEYFGIFKKETITQLKEKLMREKININLNSMHEEKNIIQGAFMTDIFQVDFKKGIQVPTPLIDQDIKDGSLIALYRIEDENVWGKVKDGTYQGFSIEAILDEKAISIKKVNMSKPNLLQTIMQRKFGKQKTFSTATTVDGTVVNWEGELIEGSMLTIEADGNQIPAPAGPHQLSDETGKVWAIELDDTGKVTKIEEVEEMTNEEVMEQVAEVMVKLKEDFTSQLTAQKTAHEKEIADLKLEIASMKDSKFKAVVKTKVGDNEPQWKKL